MIDNLNKKIIETERLMIKPFRESYITSEYLTWLNDKDLMRFSEQRHLNHTIESAKNYLESFNGTTNFFWAIFTKDGERHIGTVNSYVDRNNLVADIGILIGSKNLKREGYGEEIWNGVMSFFQWRLKPVPSPKSKEWQKHKEEL